MGNKVSLFLRSSAQGHIAELTEYLQKLPGVKELEYVSQSEALKEFERTLPEGVTGPPRLSTWDQLPGSFRLTIDGDVDLEMFVRELPGDLPIDEGRLTYSSPEEATCRRHLKPQGTRFVPTRVVSRRSWFDNLGRLDPIEAGLTGSVDGKYAWAITIDKGSAEGIQKDMAVVEQEGLVGRIVEVDEHTATVLLLISPDAAAGAIVREGGETGTVRGRGLTEQLAMDFVPGDASVEVGSVVLTSGRDDGIFPPGLIIGNVSDVSGESSDLQLGVSVQSSVDFEGLQEVVVLRKTGPNLE